MQCSPEPQHGECTPWAATSTSRSVTQTPKFCKSCSGPRQTPYDEAPGAPGRQYRRQKTFRARKNRSRRADCRKEPGLSQCRPRLLAQERLPSLKPPNPLQSPRRRSVRAVFHHQQREPSAAASARRTKIIELIKSLAVRCTRRRKLLRWSRTCHASTTPDSAERLWQSPSSKKQPRSATCRTLRSGQRKIPVGSLTS